MAKPSTALLLSKALSVVSARWTSRQRGARRMIGGGDPFDRMVLARLLDEALAKSAFEALPRRGASVLFMDRLGGGDGAQAALPLIDALGARSTGATFVHVSFSTPSRGLGALLRTTLARAGAKSRVHVEVVAHDRPAEGLVMTEAEADALVDGCHLAITYAPSGSAGLLALDRERADHLLARSHVALLSFVDPESLVAGLPGLARAIDADLHMDAIRFWAQVDDGDKVLDLGHCTLRRDGGDAQERLWVLLDNAKRRRYRVLSEPMRNDLPAGDPLLCPCRGLIESGLIPELRLERVVPAGDLLVAVGARA